MELLVIEDAEGIEDSILRTLSAQSLRRRRVNTRYPALLVVSPRAAERGLPLPDRCRTVLLPGELGGVPLCAASAVSYGVSPRDSLTVSSREGGTLWVALQRELVTTDGRIVERQEFPLPLKPWEHELPALATAGALLLLGVPPEKLSG